MTRIELTNISKKFNLDFNIKQSALIKAMSFISKGRTKKEFWALKNISFQAKSGENIGIIGRNGSGKSTLLRIIAGIYLPNKGIIKTNGEIAYVTGFNQGLKPKLTMRENIYLVGSIMGLSQTDIKKRFDEIVDFSGLKDYVDIKLYKFSSGMVTRLASSIGIHCLYQKNPDILLLDEVLGAGADINYQKKALRKMEELIKGGSTVILASHNLNSIRKYCHKVICIDDGKIISQGEPKRAVEIYKGLSKQLAYKSYKSKGIISHKYKFIYFPIYKVASSSLKTMMAQLLDIEDVEALMNVHSIEFPLVDNPFRYPDYFKFCFVRNPWERIVSCYEDKIRKDKKITNPWFLEGICRGFLRYGNLFRVGMSFEEFLEVVKDIPDSKADQHFRSQFTFITDKNKNLLVDFMGRFENIDKDFKIISDRIGLGEMNLVHKNPGPGKKKHYQKYYNERTKKIFRQRYKEDIELLNYKF